ncbi:MAG: 2-thiouracil desulfurase family protein [Candidatus Bathyarchaeota archaeon]|nr:2-thiouracil desulfurase family protein [Candidatus Bathyarchaeota archaeon]MDH5746242.1 2-thiouracil desulfurase family protein [Candidatus Bathyarchaeota archaeon]
MLKDKRSGKIAVVAHCILNQNSRVLGLAERASAITEIVEFLIRKDIGIIQMPCPELSYAGILRRGQTKDQCDNAMFRKHCRKIAKEIVDQIGEYAKCRIKTKIVIGVDGSPSCGVNETLTGNPRALNMAEHERVKGSGILIEELHLALRKRKISIPFYGIRYERLPEDLVVMERLLED